MQMGKLKIKKLLKKYAPPAVLKKAIKRIPSPIVRPPLPGTLPVPMPGIIKKPMPRFAKRKRRATTMPVTLPPEPVTTVSPLPVAPAAPASPWADSYDYSQADPWGNSYDYSQADPWSESDYLSPPEEIAPLEPMPSITDNTDMDTGYMDTAPEMFDVEEFIESEPDYYEGDFSGLSDAAAQQNTTAAQTAQPWYATFLTQALSVYQQEQLRKENSNRARAGLPPLSVEEFKSTLPAAQVEVGMTPEIKRLLTYGGIAVVAAIALPALLRRR